MIQKILITALCLCFLSSCASKKEEEIDTRNAEQLYNDGLKEVKDKSYKAAAELFSKAAYEFPYEDLAPKAHIMEIYSYYLAADYDSMIPAIDNYLKIFPASSELDYVYYLRVLAYYEQIDAPVRDQTMTFEAKSAIEELLARFPDSKYAQDVKLKLDLVNDHLAAQEMDVARYYLHSGNIISAINRFKAVIDTYQTTTHIQEALYRLVECYNFLGLHDEALKNAQILGYNYPSSKWYKEAYALVDKYEKKDKRTLSAG